MARASSATTWCRVFLRRGEDVVVLDNFSTGPRSRLDPFAAHITVVEGDIRDSVALDAAIAGCDTVFHEAAMASVAHSMEEPRLTNEINVAGTIELMLAAVRARVHRVVFAGSSSAYGASTRLPSKETDPVDPRSPYAASKLAAEFNLHLLGEMHKTETVVLRYFNVFGPGQDPTSDYAAVIPRFITAALDGMPATIYGDGTQTRDFVYVDDVVNANVLASTASGVSGLTCNVGSEKRRSLLDLHAAIDEAMGGTPQPVFRPPRAGEVRDSEADISLATDRIGFRVAVPFEEGIRRTVAAYGT